MSRTEPAEPLAELRRSALRGFVGVTLATLAAAVGLGQGLGFSVLFPLKAVLVPAAVAVMVWPHLDQHLPHRRLGPANALTLGRAVLIGLLVGLIGEPAAEHWPWLIAGLAWGAVAIDGFDGLVARASGVSSGLGGRLDMEVDALLVLALSVVVWQIDRAGAYVLLAGGARYAYAGAARFYPWLNGELPPSNHRKLCFATFVWCMVCVPLPLLTDGMAWATSFIATLLLLLSFAVDVAWLRANRGGQGSLREDLEPAAPGDLGWAKLVAAAEGRAPLVELSGEADAAMIERFAPLLEERTDRPLVFAHLAQSLDGRIALADGESQWISGPQDLEHTHRLRALADAVVIGVETALLDDPRLTVREVAGSNPLRVVLDPKLRLSGQEALCRDGQAETLILCDEERVPDAGRLGDARVMGLPARAGRLRPADILAALGGLGVSRVFVEGGGVTISGFLEAGCLDRLHLVVAPVLLGSGRPAFSLAELPALSEALRPDVRVSRLGGDCLYDLDLSAACSSSNRTGEALAG